MPRRCDVYHHFAGCMLAIATGLPQPSDISAASPGTRRAPRAVSQGGITLQGGIGRTGTALLLERLAGKPPASSPAPAAAASLGPPPSKPVAPRPRIARGAVPAATKMLIFAGPPGFVRQIRVSRFGQQIQPVQSQAIDQVKL